MIVNDNRSFLSLQSFACSLLIRGGGGLRRNIKKKNSFNFTKQAKIYKNMKQNMPVSFA